MSIRRGLDQALGAALLDEFAKRLVLDAFDFQVSTGN